MIEFLETSGYITLLTTLILFFAVVEAKRAEGLPTDEENAEILKSTKYRSNTFLTTDRAESKWGTE